MLKVLSILFTALLFVSCSSNDSKSPDQSQHITILKAPSNNIVSVYQTFSILTSSSLDETTVNSSNIYILDHTDQPIDSRVKLNPENKSEIYIEPYLYFKPNSDYTLVITTSLKDAYGRNLSKNYTFAFSTGSSSNPGGQISLVDKNPDDATVAAKNTHIALGFDRFVAPSDNPPFKVTDITSSQQISGQFEYFNSEIVFFPDADLVAGNSIEVSFTTDYPTDMYGNTYNTVSGTSFSFSVEGSAIGSSHWDENTTLRRETGHTSSKLRFLGPQDTYDYLAVARDGGVDIYRFNTVDDYWDSGVYRTFSIASEITDMVFARYANVELLLVSTVSDGIFVINATDKTAMTSTQYLQDIGLVYGVGYSTTGTTIDRVYAVGPNIGMYVYSVNTSGALSLLKNVSISGTPLKVTSDDVNTTSSYTIVSDYDNGLIAYDKDGNFVQNIPKTAHLKHVNMYPDVSENVIVATDSLGKAHSAGDISMSLDITVQLSSQISDVTHLSSQGNICFSLDRNGLDCRSPFDLGTTYFQIDQPGTVSAAEVSYDTFVTISRDGVIRVYDYNMI